MEREQLSYCRICAAACGITVTVDDEQVVRVRGDADHPVSRGYTCTKGRGLADVAPRRRPARPTPAARARGRVGRASRRPGRGAARHRSTAPGPTPSALYLATGLAYDAAGQIAAGAWLGALGSTLVLHGGHRRQRAGAGGRRARHRQRVMNPVWDPTSAGLLLAGRHQPGGVARLRHDAARPGAPPPRPPAQRRAHLGARPAPHRDGGAGRPPPRRPTRAPTSPCWPRCVRALLADGADTDELRDLLRPDDVDALRPRVCPVHRRARGGAAGLDADAARRPARRPAGPSRPARGVVRHRARRWARDGVLGEWLRWALLIAHRIARPPGRHALQPRRDPGCVRRVPGDRRRRRPGPPSRPDLPRVASQMPGGRPGRRDRGRQPPGPGRHRRQPDRRRSPSPTGCAPPCASLDVLAVVDVADSELTALATHVLPATGQLERADLTHGRALSVRSAMQSTAAVVAPVADRRPSWWILGQLGRSRSASTCSAAPIPTSSPTRSTSAGSSALTPRRRRCLRRRRSAASTSRRVRLGARDDAARRALADRAAELRRAPRRAPRPTPAAAARRRGRDMAWSNSVRYGSRRERARLRLHPLDDERGGRSRR